MKAVSKICVELTWSVLQVVVVPAKKAAVVVTKAPVVVKKVGRC